MSNVDMFPITDPEERLKAIMEGIRRAYVGINDTDKQMAIQFSVEFAQTHRYFEGGDILAAWRLTKNLAHRKIALKDWRNKWGAFVPSLKKTGMIKAVDRVRPKNIQSHNNSAVLWESMIYVGNEPERINGYAELARLVSEVEAENKTIKQAIWAAYKQGVEQK